MSKPNEPRSWGQQMLVKLDEMHAKERGAVEDEIAAHATDCEWLADRVRSVSAECRELEFWVDELRDHVGFHNASVALLAQRMGLPYHMPRSLDGVLRSCGDEILYLRDVMESLRAK